MSNSLLFMKSGSVILIAAVCSLMLCGCKDKKPKFGAPMNVQILGVSGSADLKPGLKLGLFVGEPVRVDNAPLTVVDGGLVLPDVDIRWVFDQSQSSRFFAYAPYDQSYTGQESVTIRVPTDQSTEEKMLQGNLMTATASGSPKETSVKMKLSHAMTAMTVSFDNRSGQKITSLSVKGFMTSGTFDLLTGTLKATSEKAAITPLRSPDDENSFSFIYIPQDVSPYFYVTLSSGKELVFMYDKYCHEYPGSVIRMNIQIDESTQGANILELKGVNISQWMTNGVPSFTDNPEYICLDGLRNVKPDDSKGGFFSAYLNKVYVTAVDRTASDIYGVILEDSTCAIHVWADNDSPLKEGNTIVGPILGLMNKPSADEFHISHFYTSYATVGKTDTLPCTQGTFAGLAGNIDDWEYRRMLFRHVTLKSGFTNDRAVFLQGTTRVSVVCPGIDISLAEGAMGDLIGFPVRSGSDITVMAYDAGQFNSFSKEAADNALTMHSTYGLYDMSEYDTAIYVMQGPDPELQYSFRIFDIGRTMQVADTRNGEVLLFVLYDCTDVPGVGHEYTVAFNALGNSSVKGSTITMECVKFDENTAWLIDKKGKYGLVLAL